MNDGTTKEVTNRELCMLGIEATLNIATGTTMVALGCFSCTTPTLPFEL